MEELAPQVVAPVKAFVEAKVAVLPVRDHGVVELGEVEADLVHPPG